MVRYYVAVIEDHRWTVLYRGSNYTEALGVFRRLRGGRTIVLLQRDLSTNEYAMLQSRGSHTDLSTAVAHFPRQHVTRLDLTVRLSC